MDLDRDSDVELRLRTLRTGLWPTLLASAFTAAYALATFDRPHRAVLLMLPIVAAASGCVVAVLPMEHIIRRWPRTFFLAWTASFVIVIATGAVADGGTASPLTAEFFLPIAFSSLSYPPRWMAVVGAMNLIAYALVTFLGEHHYADALLFVGTLATATWICAWQTRNHEWRRRQLARVSRTDELTGALNRRGFEERARAELAVAGRAGTTLGLVLLDLDRFKEVNDSHGHQAGDELLREVGAVLGTVLRAGDAVGRIGGDEFALLLADGDTEACLVRVQAMLAPVAAASAGAAAFPVDGEVYDDLYRAADTRLYEAKRGEPRLAPTRMAPRGRALQ